MIATLELRNAEATAAAGASLASVLAQRQGGVITLEGPLGAGKTTLARGLLRALGVTGVICSPTYTLLEPYQTRIGMVLHVDLYRLAGAEEMLGLGLDDYAPDACWWLVEWPDRANGYLPEVAVRLRLHPLRGGRHLRIEGAGELVRAMFA